MKSLFDTSYMNTVKALFGTNSSKKENDRSAMHMFANKGKHPMGAVWYVNRKVIDSIVIYPASADDNEKKQRPCINDTLKTIKYTSVCPASLFVLFFERKIKESAAVFRGVTWKKETIWANEFAVTPFIEWKFKQQDTDPLVFYDTLDGIKFPLNDATRYFFYVDRTTKLVYSAELDWDTTPSSEFASAHEPGTSPRA